MALDLVLLLAVIGVVQSLVLLAQLLLVQNRRDRAALVRFQEESRSTPDSIHRLVTMMNLRSLRNDASTENLRLESEHSPQEAALASGDPLEQSIAATTLDMQRKAHG
jgi:hypothetical protein